MGIRQTGGWALIGAMVMIVLGMSHHPHSLRSESGGIVHGFMILALMVTTFGFAIFVIDRGPVRALMLAGSVAFATAVFAGTSAAMINGFVAPALVASGEPLDSGVHRLAWAANQAFAGLGVVATGTAFLIWSTDLLRRGGRFAKLTGAVGVLAAIGPAGLLLVGALRMNVTGAFLIYAAQALWGALVGIQMLAQPKSERDSQQV